MGTAERPEPGQRASGLQWAAIDWCARLRPAIWLDAAGLSADADRLRRHRPVDGAATLEGLWPALSRSAEATLAARQACWRDFASGARQLGKPDLVEGLAVMASVAWPSAVAAARHLAVRAAEVARFPDTARVVFRTLTLPDGPGVGWDQAWDVARDAACIVTCRAVHELVTSMPWIWAAATDQTWTVADEAIRRALAPVLIELTRAATAWMEPRR